MCGTGPRLEKPRKPLAWRSGLWCDAWVAKTLCDWTKKDIEKRYEALCEIVAEPKFVCVKCARCAGSSSHLCKARKLRRGEAMPGEGERGG